MICQYLISSIELDYQPICVNVRRAGKESTEYSDLRELPVCYMLDSVKRFNFETVICTSLTFAIDSYFC